MVIRKKSRLLASSALLASALVTSALVTGALMTGALVTSATVQAAGPLKLHPGMTGVADLGATDCAIFSQMYPNGPNGMRQATLTWAQGYFYAQSGKSTDEILASLPLDNPWNFDTLSGHVINDCETHPDNTVADAVVDLWQVLATG